MDNAAIHHHPVSNIVLFESLLILQDLEAICQEAGVILAYLPPYSPDLNSIEEAFAQLKAWFRKNYNLAESMPFDEFLSLGLELMKDSVRNHFARSRIGVPIRDGDDEDYYHD